MKGKLFGAFLGASLLSLAAGNSSAAILLQNDFESGLGGWATTGTANVRPFTDTINTSVGTDGFDNSFSSQFAVLGDVTGKIGGSPNSGVGGLTSGSFSLAAGAGDYLTLSFDYALDGTGVGTGPNQGDAFSVSVVDAATQTSVWSNTWSSVSSGPYAAAAGTFSSLGAGTYQLVFRLNEVSGSGSYNSAAGIDNVVVAVPEPETWAMLGLGALLIGLRLRQKGAQIEGNSIRVA